MPPSPSAAGRFLAYLRALGPAWKPPKMQLTREFAPRRLAPWYWYSGFAGGKNARNVGHLVEVDPEAAHGVVHAGEDLHGDVAGVVAYEFLVDFEDAFELAAKRGSVDVCQVEINHGLASRRCQGHARCKQTLVNGAGGDVARDEVAVFL